MSTLHHNHHHYHHPDCPHYHPQTIQLHHYYTNHQNHHHHQQCLNSITNSDNLAHHHYEQPPTHHHPIIHPNGSQLSSPSPDILVLNDDDKLSIISRENVRKLSILPNHNKKREFRRGEPGRRASDSVTSTFIRRWINAVGFVDLLLFTSSIILSLTTEKYVCHDGPVQLGKLTGLFSLSNSSYHDYSPVVGTIERFPTVYEFVRDDVLGRLVVDSPIIYHTVVIGLLTIGTTYFVLEVWLFCILIKIARNPRVSSSIKWLSYRSLILSITLLITVYDVAFTHQATCSELVFVPIQVVRSVIGGVPVMWVIYSGGVGSGLVRTKW